MGKPQSKRDTREPEIIEEICLKDLDALRTVCGERDRNLQSIEAKFGVTLHPRGNVVRVIGPRSSANQALGLLSDLYDRALSGQPVGMNEIHDAPDPLQSGNNVKSLNPDARDTILVTYKNVKLGPKTPGQQRYLDAMLNNDVVFASGPAGTGKTYLAVLMAVQQLLAGDVRRIILTRPAVEAGERLGFLPGDLSEKVNPYLRPLYDALHDMLPFERVQQMLSVGEIEVAPLAFMRGRTLNDAFIILDEAQNTTPDQMKMFLTRIGKGGRAVVTGDITQTDLPGLRYSGLADAMRILKAVNGVGMVALDQADIVRHRIVQAIIDAYESSAKSQNLELPLRAQADTESDA